MAEFSLDLRTTVDRNTGGVVPSIHNIFTENILGTCDGFLQSGVQRI
jgi:hypothetical protein